MAESTWDTVTDEALLPQLERMNVIAEAMSALESCEPHGGIIPL